MKLHGIMPFASLAVSTPTTVPAGALAATVKLLIVIVMTSPVWQRGDTGAPLSHRNTRRPLSMIGSLLSDKCEKVNNHIAYVAFMDGCLRVGVVLWTHPRAPS